MIYSCCNENRRSAVLGNPTLNGIDYLEIADRSPFSTILQQQTLLVYCLKPVPTNLTPANVLIEGGESITAITAQWILPASATTALPDTATAAELAYFNTLILPANILVIRTSVAGDFSQYTLRLVNDASAAVQDSFDVTEALTGFDPQLAEVSFSFKIDCPPFFDCAPPSPNCKPDLPTPPPINYLAKDYGSFRSIMLDRMNQLLPNWGASSEADMGIALAELIAYVGDKLSYQQDAVATEAYLATARSRISLRRHALLVDYRVHDGCNARAWVQIDVNNPVTLDHTATRFYTYAPGFNLSLAVGAGNEQAALDAGVIVFEPMQDADLFPEHNSMQFYTWGDANCCLPQGATEATLLGSYPNLQVGDVLIFQEVMGPQTGVAADADIRHRYAVRLTSVATEDGQGLPLVDPLFEEGTGLPITTSAQMPTAVTEIQWSAEDALPATLCLSSSFINSSGGTTGLTGVSIAFGNIVLADHGLSINGMLLPTVPGPTLFVPGSASADNCNPKAATPLPVRYRPQLPQSPVTQSVGLPLTGSPVTSIAMPLQSTSFVSLSDSSGFTCLMVKPDAPLFWPQYFGIQCAVSATPDSFDLSIVFDPPGGASGVGGAVLLEEFTALTIASVAVAINGISRFITVTSMGATTPTSFPSDPVMLPNSGSINLEDAASVDFLTVQPTNPLSWPPQFAVLAQGDIGEPTRFNLLLLYQPTSGAVGVEAPVVVEQFLDLTLETVDATFITASNLLSVLTFEGEPNPSLSAYALMNYDANQALPVITLDDSVHSWSVAPDLLADGPADMQFVVEVEANGVASIRFGDDTNGMRPLSGTTFVASYRIGNGTAGNLGADSLTFVAGDPRITSCSNPLPAAGGVDPETMAQIRRRAPQAFLTQERAVTMTDYATITEQNPQVEDAYATLRWTGSWYTVFITAEPLSNGTQSGSNLSKQQEKTLTQYVNRFRLAGQDLKLQGPDYISLEIKLTVCVDPAYFQADVEQSLLQALGSGTQFNGKPAAFAPGSFKLGQTVYLSPIYAAARSVTGVQSVTAHVFQPQGIATKVFLQRGEIPLGPFQVARMDNDPSRPANGQLTLVMKGGK